MQTRFFSPRRSVAVPAGVTLALLSLAGCAHNEPPPPTIVNTPAPPAAAPAPSVATATPGMAPVAATPGTKINTNAGPGGSTGTDTALAQQVKTAIMENNQMTGARVEVVATSGVVTLNGWVQNQTQKR